VAPGTEAAAGAEQSPGALCGQPLLVAIAAGRGQAGGNEPSAQRGRHGRRHCSRPGFAPVGGALTHPPAQETAAPGSRAARCTRRASGEVSLSRERGTRGRVVSSRRGGGLSAPNLEGGGRGRGPPLPGARRGGGTGI
jgi:hypothetical protein